MSANGKAYFLLYDDYADFDVMFTAAIMRPLGIVSVGLGKTCYRTASHFKVMADMQIEDLDPSGVELFVIPGGSPAKTLDDPALQDRMDLLYEKLRRMDGEGKKIAAICAGAEVLYRAGMLEGRRFTHGYKEHAMSSLDGFTGEMLSVDGNIITAKGEAYPEFAVEVARAMGMYKSEEEAQEDLRYIRGR